MAKARLVQSGSVMKLYPYQGMIEFNTVAEANEHISKMKYVAKRRRKSYWLVLWKYVASHDDYMHIDKRFRKKRWWSKIYRETQTRINFNK